MTRIYTMGSMRNPAIPLLAARLRLLGYDVFDDWHSPGPEADDKWQEYEKVRGRTYKEALAGWHPHYVFNIDKHHLDRSDVGVLVLPAGKSAHIELGYLRGSGKPGYILFDQEPERYDIMYKFATDIFFSEDELVGRLMTDHAPTGKLYQP
jgi:nucleoside 2-deoxyribosyltransferase